MLKYIDHNRMGRGQHGWLDSHFHFSFAEYYNPDNMGFGALRVVNDDIVQAQTGFDTHPHKNMEIISYVIKGELSHADSMGNTSTLTRGNVQYMSAGTGVLHSEHNLHESGELRFLQIWILPDLPGHKPNYGEYRFVPEERFDKWLHIATSYENSGSDAPVKLHQDINMYATILGAGKSADFTVDENRQAYFVCVEGEANIGGIHLATRDALEDIGEIVTIATVEGCHIVVIEMHK
jgi:redox-sensitive bicupin YhaK (pirin superfamily)